MSEAIKSVCVCGGGGKCGGGKLGLKVGSFKQNEGLYPLQDVINAMLFSTFPLFIALSNNRHNTFSRMKNTKPSGPRPPKFLGGHWVPCPPAPPPPPVPTPLRWMDGWMDRGIARWVGGWEDGWIDGWEDGRMEGRMDGEMDGNATK